VLQGVALPAGIVLEAAREWSLAGLMALYGPRSVLARDPVMSVGTLVVMALFAIVLVLALVRGL
jgi:hypothetical protein